MSTTVRISPVSLQALKQIALQAGEPMQAVLDKAIELYRRQWFLEQVNKAFASLKENPEAWEEELSERREWEVTINDGLQEDS